MKKYWSILLWLSFSLIAMEPNAEISAVSQEKDLWTNMQQEAVKFYQNKFPEQGFNNLKDFAEEALFLLPTLQQGLQSLDLNWLENQASAFFGYYIQNDQDFCKNIVLKYMHNFCKKIFFSTILLPIC